MSKNKGAALLALASVIGGCNALAVDTTNEQVQDLCEKIVDFHEGGGEAGSLEVGGQTVQVMLPAFAFAICFPMEFDFSFGDPALDNANNVIISANSVNNIRLYVASVEIDDGVIGVEQDFIDFATAVNAAIVAGVAGDVTNAVEQNGLQLLNEANVNNIANMAAVGMTAGVDFGENKGVNPIAPGAGCLVDEQCIGNRDQRFRRDLVERTCDLENEELGIQRCNDYVAQFALRWLLAFIIASYGILILWALYWIIPYCTKGKKRSKGSSKEPKATSAEQLLINTLASQCASAENMLLVATDYLKQARGMESVQTIEAKRESKLMIYLCEYFHVCCSIMTALTHQYLHDKTFTEGEKYDIDDATTRALQLEVLNYIRARIYLAFNSDSMSEKSLVRLAEAHIIMKKVTESLCFVGFAIDRAFEDSLGTLKTPKVQFTENAFFLGGICVPGTPGLEEYANSQVCITIGGADTRGVQKINADNILKRGQKSVKNYDAMMMMTQNTVGECYAYKNKADDSGEGAQYFVRTFWGPEIAAAQNESQKWARDAGELEKFLDRERVEREQRAQPMVKQGSNPSGKRKKRRKKKKGGDGETQFTDNQDAKTEYTEATEASGWTVADENNFVYNVTSVSAHGLGIAGSPSVPFDKPNESPVRKKSRFWAWFEVYFPNYAEWPKFYTLFFIIIPIIIIAPMLANIGKGSEEIDIDGNVNFKARPAGFGYSFLGVPNYYFLDGEVPEADDLVVLDATLDANAVNVFLTRDNGGDIDDIVNYNPFGEAGKVFVSNDDTFEFFDNDWNGRSNRRPDLFIAELQGGILAQADLAGLDGIRNQQIAQETSTMFVYGLMHIGAYFFGMVPLTLIRESLEILARYFPIIKDIYPLSQWRELHMSMGLCGILFVVFGSTVFLITQIVAIGKHTPFAGNGGDPNIPLFFSMTDNVLYIRQLLLPAVPLLLLMKYAARGPPAWVRKYMPTWFTLYYWEICYFLHYLTALAAIIILVIYRAQVFYWMGVTWGVVWGGNKIVRILRTRRATIQSSALVSYCVEDSRNNAKKKSDVCRIVLNVPPSFPATARGQACWLTIPSIDFIAHPFTLAKTPNGNDNTIMFHIAVRYLPGDDVISYARPDTAPAKAAAPAAAPEDPNALPPGWKTAVDPTSGQTYYYNTDEKRTTWSAPKKTTGNAFFQGVRGITTRMSANFLRGNSSAKFGGALNLQTAKFDAASTKQFIPSNRPSWTQKLAVLLKRIQNMDPHLRNNAMKDIPVYVSSPLGTSMDRAIDNTNPGSIIITTQNGLPAAESCVRWLMNQDSSKRPVFHFFVSVCREVNDVLPVVEMLRDAMIEAVTKGHLNIEGVNVNHSHMADWFSAYIHLTRRKGNTILGDREMLFNSLNKPTIPIDERRLGMIEAYIKSRIRPGRLAFDRFLARTQQMVKKRAGDDRMVVAYCGSSKVANSLRAACRGLKNVSFDGEYI